MPEDVCAVIGGVIRCLVLQGRSLTLHEIIDGLYSMSEGTTTKSIREACLQAIAILARQMH